MRSSWTSFNIQGFPTPAAGMWLESFLLQGNRIAVLIYRGMKQLSAL